MAITAPSSSSVAAAAPLFTLFEIRIQKLKPDIVTDQTEVRFVA